MITDHHDGHGLAELLVIKHDDRDTNAGGASHKYDVHYLAPAAEEMPEQTGVFSAVARIKFQHGPRHVEGSTPGILDSVLIAIVLDRLRCFQAGPFASRENAIIITKLEESLMWMKKRADDRSKRGVLGKNEK